MSKRVCGVNDCERVYEAQGYCQLHYNRFRKHGDPHKGALRNAGMTNTDEYRTWIAVRRRTRSPNYKDYARYGAVGVDISDELYDNYQLFLKTLGPKPSKTHSINRIDGTKGYEIGNIEWATKHEQAANRKSTYIIPGVNINNDGRKSKYHAELSMNGKRIFNRYFSTVEEAIKARKEKELEYGIYSNNSN